MPLRDFECTACGHEEKDQYVRRGQESTTCSKCGQYMVAKTALVGGYKMNSGGSSTRPRNAGSFKKGKP